MKKENKMAFLTPEEILKVLRVAKEKSLRDHCMVLLSYRHGLRASEICALRLSDVDMKTNSLTVQRLKGSLKTVQPLYPHRGQPLLDEQKALRAYLEVRPKDGSQALFVSQKGGTLDRSAWFRAFQSIAEDAGLDVSKRHPHCLKHSLATHLISGNVNLALVKQALGHQTIDSTMKYIGTTDEQASEALQRALLDLF